MKALYLIALAAVLGLTACESKQEEAREDALEQKADNLEKQAEQTREAK